MKAVVAAFNQEKALVGAFSVITNLRMELLEALVRSGRGGQETRRMCPGRELELSADHIYNNNNNNNTSHSSSVAVTAERILLKQNQSCNGIVLLDVFIRSGPGPPIEMTIAPLLTQATTQYIVMTALQI